jgi:hypothetical protein
MLGDPCICVLGTPSPLQHPLHEKSSFTLFYEHLCTATVCPHWQLTYGLSADAVQGLRAGAPLPGARHTAARILLFLDGFDELQAEEGGEELTRDTRLRLRNLYATVCGGITEAWSPDVLRVVVTSRESRFNGRADERAVCGAHRRRVLLPFNQQQVP